MVGVTSCDQFYGPQDTEKPRPNPGWIHHGVPASEARRWHLANRSRRHPTATRGTSLPSQTTGVAMGNEDIPKWSIWVKGSSAHANPDHMYTQSPFEALKITCARSWGSHVQTSEPTITCTHKWDHLRTQIQITCAHKYSATAITCTHHYSYTLIKRHYSYTLIKSHETFRVYRLLHLM